MRRPRRSQLAAALAVAGLLLAACGGDDGDGASETEATAAETTTGSSADTTAAEATTTVTEETSDAPTETTKIRFALDWTPNTNHTGLYVAIHEGYFEEAGIEVEVLPYNATSPDVLVGSGSAEFGISFHSSLTFSRAAGSPIKSVMAVVQHTVTGIGVRADNAEINSPKDLDGKVYAGFGAPGEVETIAQVIKNDGGTGEFDSVTLSTAAYEAVYAGEADFTVPFITWEGIEAELRGTPFKTFKYTDFGFPDEYAVVVIGNEDWMADNPELAAAFVQALQKGYEFGVQNPEEAAQILIDENPDAFPEEELVFKSQELLAAEYFANDAGEVGVQTLEQWEAYSSFLYDQGLLVDEGGSALTEPPDYASFFTNEYLVAG